MARRSKKNELKTQTLKQGFVADAAIILLVVFALMAIDSGSYWHYLGAIASFVIAIKFTKKAFKTYGQFKKAK